MGFLKSFKARLLAGVFALVIGSSLGISLLVYHRYNHSYYQQLTDLGLSLTQAIALQAVDMILINDLVALQKMLDQQHQSYPNLAYLFIVRHGDVLAHTFAQGLPVGLPAANQALGAEAHLEKIITPDGEQYLDIAWPIFEGKAGTLRVGVTEQPFREQIRRLWLQIGGLTIGILAAALTAALFFIGRLTRPISALAQATRQIAQGQLNVRVPVAGQDEAAMLVISFNQMVQRLEEYTRRLEVQAAELSRANLQNQTFCEIVQMVGSLDTLDAIGAFLCRRLGEIAEAHQLMVLVAGRLGDHLVVLSAGGSEVHHDPKTTQTVYEIITRLKGTAFSENPIIPSPPLPPEFASAGRHAVVPFEYEAEVQGALVLACSSDCPCEQRDLSLLSLIMAQAAGVILRAISHEEEIHDLQKRFETETQFGGLIGKDQKIQGVYRLITEVAATEATVLIQGESGTGKELVAWAIHQRSPRQDKPFVVINCAAYPPTLLESELFGHERGAFTGAVRQKIGRFELAQGGTIFLDEVGEIPPPAQVKLLRVIQNQKFERLGGEKTISLDIRILAATNKDLLSEVEAGRFREDLYYRLNVIQINLPRLSDRLSDVPLLARYFLRRFCIQQNKEQTDFAPETMRRLLEYSWPGNVRELENTIEHAVIMAKGRQIVPMDLPPRLHRAAQTPAASLIDHERKLLLDTLDSCAWNKKQAAARLGISRSTLYDKIKKYSLVEPTAH